MSALGHKRTSPFSFDDLVGARRSDGAMARPIYFAALRLITSSYLVGCSTGMSVGFTPLENPPCYCAKLVVQT